MSIFTKYGIMASQGGELSPQWDVQYNANVLPENATPSWNLIEIGGSSTLNGDGTFNLTTTGGVFRIYTRTTTMTTNKTKRIEARLRVNDSDGDTNYPSQGITISDGSKSATVFLVQDGVSNGVFVGTQLNTPTKLYDGNMSDYNTIRFEVNDVDGLDLYVNGVLEGNYPYSSFRTRTSNSIEFGDGQDAFLRMNADVDWQYVYYQLDLESNPDQ